MSSVVGLTSAPDEKIQWRGGPVRGWGGHGDGVADGCELVDGPVLDLVGTGGTIAACVGRQPPSAYLGEITWIHVPIALAIETPTLPIATRRVAFARAITLG